MKERRVQITVRAPAGLLDPLPKKKLADFALVQAPESRPLLRRADEALYAAKRGGGNAAASGR